MLQRQIMLKQLQELQRRGQLQELGDARDNYINPLSPLKQASGGQFQPSSNGTPVLDSSQMFMGGNMRMMQHGDSGVFSRSPNGLVFSQSQNLGVDHVGISQPQLDTYLYGTPARNSEKNLYNSPYLLGPTTNLLPKNNNISLQMPDMHPPTFSNAFVSQQCDFPLDQISMPNGSLLPNQFFQDRNLFRQVPVQSISRRNLAGSYSEEGNTTPSNALTLESEGRCEDASWHVLSTRKSSNLGQSSLDPLEQKILYNADDHSWESPFCKTSNIGTGDFSVENTSYMDALSSTQNGSWSALMQSAVAETSSSDTGMQEEWSGLSFQNPGLSVDNQPTNFFDTDKQHHDWVDGISPNAVSPSFKLESLTQNSNRNSSYPGFQQSNHHLRQQEEFHSESSHISNQISSTYTSQLADYSSQLKRLTGVGHLIQASLHPSNIWPGQDKEHMTGGENQSHILLQTGDNQTSNDFSGQDLRGTSWLDGSASYHLSGGVQKPFDDVNELTIPRYSTESEKMVPGHDVECVSAFLSSPGVYSQSVAAQSENMLSLLNKDDISDDHTPGVHLNSKVSNPNELPLTDSFAATFSIPCKMAPISQDFDFRLCPTDPWTPEPYSFFPSLSTGRSTATSSVRAVKDSVKKQNPKSPLQNNMATNLPTLSATDVQEYSYAKTTRSDDSEFPLLENLPVSQWVVTSTPKTSYGSSSLFRSLDSVSSSQENSSEVLNDQPNQSSFRHENNKQESLPRLGKSKDYEQKLEKRSSLHQGLTEINISMPLSSSADKQDILRNLYLQADAVSDPLVTHTNQLTPNQASHVDKQTLSGPARDMRSLGLDQNFSLLQPSITADTDNGLSLPLKYDNSYYQQATADATEFLFSGHKSGVEDEAKGDLNFVPQIGAYFTRDNKGQKLSGEVQGDEFGKDSSFTYPQNLQQTVGFGQNGTQRQSIGSNEASCATYGSQISLQMAPTWFRHYGTLTNEQRLQVCDPNTAFNAGKPLTGTTLGKLQRSSLMMPANSANPSQGTDYVWPSTDINLIARKRLSSPVVLPLDVIHQNLLVSMPKRRKIGACDMVSWHKEVNHEISRLQDISSTAELEWAEASNRRLEEVKNDVEMFEAAFPFVPAKRRLILTTQLMQKVLRPAPAAILCADASSNYDCVVYSAARLTLGVACNLIGQLSSETNAVSSDQQKTSTKTNNRGFTKLVEGLICRVNKLDGDLSRLHKTSLFADIKVENQELEKISVINRFAKFHIRAQSSTIDPATSSSKSIVPRPNIQRYVMAIPMPTTVPEGIDCLSL